MVTTLKFIISLATPKIALRLRLDCSVSQVNALALHRPIDNQSDFHRERDDLTLKQAADILGRQLVVANNR